MENYIWIRLLNAFIEVAAVTALVPATIILSHYGGRFRYLFIASLWITLTAFTWLTGTRLNMRAPVNDATLITTFVTTSVLVIAGSICAWYFYMVHHDRLPARTALGA